MTRKPTKLRREERVRRLTRLINEQLSDTRIKLLMAHYNAPEHTATVAWLARKMGWRDWRAVNAHYGAMAHLVVDLLGEVRKEEVWVGNLFDWTDPYSTDAKGHVRFVMLPEVQLALKRAGFVR